MWLQSKLLNLTTWDWLDVNSCQYSWLQPNLSGRMYSDLFMLVVNYIKVLLRLWTVLCEFLFQNISWVLHPLCPWLSLEGISVSFNLLIEEMYSVFMFHTKPVTCQVSAKMYIGATIFTIIVSRVNSVVYESCQKLLIKFIAIHCIFQLAVMFWQTNAVKSPWAATS